MEKLNNDVFIDIIKFLDCKFNNKTSFYITNRTFYSLYIKYQKCKLNVYKNLKCCSYHINTKRQMDINSVINILTHENNKKIESHTRTIHFYNKEQIDIAKCYLSEYGIITHYCCNGLGVSYLDINKSTNPYYLNI
jgi:hypothetical protein